MDLIKEQHNCIRCKTSGARHVSIYIDLSTLRYNSWLCKSCEKLLIDEFNKFIANFNPNGQYKVVVFGKRDLSQLDIVKKLNLKKLKDSLHKRDNINYISLSGLSMYSFVKLNPGNHFKMVNKINLSHNRLIDFPNFSELNSLLYLDLSYNNIETSCEKIPTNLKWLNVKRNYISKWFSNNCDKLEYLNINKNKLTVMPKFYSFFPSLKDLILLLSYHL